MNDDELNDLRRVRLSDFKKIGSSFMGDIDTINKELNTIFEAIIPTESVPFASWNNICKIYRGFKPPSSEWINTSDKYISIKYTKVNTRKPEKYKYDSSYDIYYGGAGIELFGSKAKINFEHEVIPSYYNEKEVIKILAVSINSDITNIGERQVTGAVDVPGQMFQQYIIKEIVSNDPTYMDYFSIDESYQTKKSYLTLGFYKPDNSKQLFTFTMTQHSDNGIYTRIKIKGERVKSELEWFQVIMSQFFWLYNSKKTDIYNLYKSFGFELQDPNDSGGIIESVKKIPGTTKQCELKRQPSVFTEEEIALADVDNQSIRVLKISGDEGDTYHTCNGNQKGPSEYKYPGITKSSGGKKGVPCCFKTKRTAVDTTTNAPHILSGNKSVGEFQQGYIPDELNLLFNPNLPSGKHLFLRYGVKQSPQSFKECVWKSRSSDADIILDQYEETPWLAKQEMYDHSIDEIVSILDDDQTYIDPRMFVTLFGEIDKINIFMFNSNGIIKPRYANGYYKRNNNYKSIIIHEQQTVDGLYSQWEIIALVLGKDKQFIFEYDDKISIWLRGLLYQNTMSAVNQIVLPIVVELSLPDEWVVKGQMFDSSGKTRILKVLSSDNTEFIFQTTPIQPLNCAVIIVNSIEPYTPDKQRKFISSIKDLIKQQTVEGDILKITINDHVQISIPIQTQYDETSIHSPDVPIQSNDESHIRDFIKHQRLSRYVIEYAKWMFMKYGDAKDIDKFMTDRIKVDTEHRYTGITKNLSETSGVVINNQLVVDSDKAKQQVKFLLKMLILRTPTVFDKYKNITQIPEYYLNVTDFKKNLAVNQNDTRDLFSYSYNIFSGINMLEYIINKN
jgi:hypothetical protein